jgi:hypothetical protein
MVLQKRRLFSWAVGIGTVLLILDQLVLAPARLLHNSWEFNQGVYLGDFMPCKQCVINGRVVTIAAKKRCYAIIVLPSNLLLYDSSTERFALYSEFEGSGRWD